MKNKMKIVLSIICIIVLAFTLDLICIFTINKPLFAVKDKNGYVYRGLFYDTYNCREYSVPQIKFKGTKFTCTNVKVVQDKESTYNVTDIENVSISISNISLRGATIIIKDTNKKPYTYGNILQFLCNKLLLFCIIFLNNCNKLQLNSYNLPINLSKIFDLIIFI